jgi:hypothetical protein
LPLIFGQQISQLQEKIELVQLPPARLYLLVENDDDRKQTREPCRHPAIERSAQVFFKRTPALFIFVFITPDLPGSVVTTKIIFPRRLTWWRAIELLSGFTKNFYRLFEIAQVI